jgi:hypothetical protein
LVFIAPVVTTISGFGVIVGGRFNSDKMGSLEVSAGINTNKHLNIVERELFAAHLYYYFNANNNEENLNLY